MGLVMPVAAPISSMISSMGSGGYHNIDSSCKSGGEYAKWKVSDCRIRAVWLGHGAWAAPLSLLTGITAAMAATHCWVELRGQSEYFILQFGRGLEFQHVPGNSTSNVDYQGKRACGEEERDKEYTTKYDFNLKEKCTIEEIAEWCIKQDTQYDLVNNNCKHLAEAFHQHFTTNKL